MPQHKSAIKRVRQNSERRERNRVRRGAMRAMMRKLRATADPEEGRALLAQAKHTLDRLASKGLIHKNKAANYKSQLEKYVNGLDQAP